MAWPQPEDPRLHCSCDGLTQLSMGLDKHLSKSLLLVISQKGASLQMGWNFS